MKPEFAELSTAISLIEAGSLTQDLHRVVTRLEMFVDQVQAREAAREKQWREFMSDCWAVLRKLQADSELLGRFYALMAGPKPKGPPNDKRKDISEELSDWH